MLAETALNSSNTLDPTMNTLIMNAKIPIQLYMSAKILKMDGECSHASRDIPRHFCLQYLNPYYSHKNSH